MEKMTFGYFILILGFGCMTKIYYEDDLLEVRFLENLGNVNKANVDIDAKNEEKYWVPHLKQ